MPCSSARGACTPRTRMCSVHETPHPPAGRECQAQGVRVTVTRHAGRPAVMLQSVRDFRRLALIVIFVSASLSLWLWSEGIHASHTGMSFCCLLLIRLPCSGKLAAQSAASAIWLECKTRLQVGDAVQRAGRGRRGGRMAGRLAGGRARRGARRGRLSRLQAGHWQRPAGVPRVLGIYCVKSCWVESNCTHDSSACLGSWVLWQTYSSASWPPVAACQWVPLFGFAGFVGLDVF